MSKQPTHVVKHKRLYLAVDGVLTHMPEGKQLTLTAKQAKGLGKRVAPIGDGEVADLTPASETVEVDEELETLRATAKEMGIANASKMKKETLLAKIEEASAAQ